MRRFNELVPLSLILATLLGSYTYEAFARCPASWVNYAFYISNGFHSRSAQKFRKVYAGCLPDGDPRHRDTRWGAVWWAEALPDPRDGVTRGPDCEYLYRYQGQVGWRPMVRQTVRHPFQVGTDCRRCHAQTTDNGLLTLPFPGNPAYIDFYCDSLNKGPPFFYSSPE